MTPKEILEVALTVIASLGGGGAIVFGLSGFLGKFWADHALEKQKQEYAQLNISFSHQLELASKQVQAEIDRLGHLHKLRTESEFEKLSALWKTVARLRIAFRCLPHTPYDLGSEDKEAHHQSCLKWSNQFFERWREAFELWNEEALSIPQSISLTAAKLMVIANEELDLVFKFRDPFDGTSSELSTGKALTDFLNKRSKRAEEFNVKSEDLLAKIREYLEGNKAKQQQKD
jgi:hypothetical protein